MLMLLTSCEMRKHISLIVVDAQSKKPIDSVKVEIGAGYDGDYSKNSASAYTNKHGFFSCDMMLGCSRGCYDIQITYSKNGYQKMSSINQTEGMIYLAK